MPPRSQAPLRVIRASAKPPPIDSSVLGMLIFIITEVMLFAGLISAFVIVKSSAMGEWPPPGQPRLPAGETAINTLALLASGVALYYAGKAFAQERSSARKPLLAAIGLGAFFVLFQGYEWWGLLAQGLTLTSSLHGSFFYLIVGFHALHAVVALALLGLAFSKLLRHRLHASSLAAAQVLWFFVVGVWPILYALVYW